MNDAIAFEVGRVDEAAAGPRTLASAVYARLRADILSGRCRPSEKLLIASLGKRFNVSVASVREALARLVGDGLVVAEDQRGFRVPPLRVDDLMDATHTRIELETLALRRSIERGDEAWERGLRHAWRELQSVPYTSPDDRSRHTDAWSAAHGRFHAQLVAACGLEWLLKFRAVLYEHTERFRHIGFALKPSTRDVHAEHQRIVEATLARDAERATAELAQHFEATAAAIASALKQSPDPR
ncbi:MAG: FCD domain-containing protein [Acetobacteraceae bacterium]|nr:FCD domain-containing protein [Acetobacteraceae bacterium]